MNIIDQMVKKYDPQSETELINALKEAKTGNVFLIKLDNPERAAFHYELAVFSLEQAVPICDPSLTDKLVERIMQYKELVQMAEKK
jgi:hypothetical protein